MSEEIKEHESSDDFYPKGSIAFFLLLVIFMMGLWFFMYTVFMIQRA